MNELLHTPHRRVQHSVMLSYGDEMAVTDKKDYMDPACCFDTSDYTGCPDSEICEKTIPVPEIVARLDALYDKGMDAQAESYLSNWCCCAHSMGDWRGELSLLSELMGFYRRTEDIDSAMDSVNRGLDIIRTHGLGSTVSGATILLNAATTLKAFGRASESIPIFEHVCRVYGDNLAPDDYRFGGLYNNMALSYCDIGNYSMAEECYHRALSAIRSCVNPEYEMAVTYCNMAHLYDAQDPEDERIGECIENAWECLDSDRIPRDGYYRFTVSKCLEAFEYFGFFLYEKVLKERIGQNAGNKRRP